MIQLLFAILIATSFILLVVHFFFTVLAIYRGAAFVPTPIKRVRQIIKMSQPDSSDIVYDLGSGDGRILAAFANAGVRKCRGIEINPLLYCYSKIRFMFSHRGKVQIELADIWATDLSEASILAIFFIPKFMQKLEKKIKKEMKSGSKIVSYQFEFPGLTLTERSDNVYLYTV